jgi:benzoate membrane transport protein
MSQWPACNFSKTLAFTAGFVAVLVGFTSSVAIVFQAAQAFNATPEIVASWMWALGIGMGLCSLVPSLWLKKPVMVAWSTPAFLVTLSGVVIAGVGSAFWGVVAGALALLVQHVGRKQPLHKPGD